MYQNRITLIGFLGKDATAVSTNNANFTALSLATKSSYKDKTTGNTSTTPSGTAASSGASWPSTRRPSRRARMCPSKAS